MAIHAARDLFCYFSSGLTRPGDQTKGPRGHRVAAAPPELGGPAAQVLLSKIDDTPVALVGRHSLFLRYDAHRRLRQECGRRSPVLLRDISLAALHEACQGALWTMTLRLTGSQAFVYPASTPASPLTDKEIRDDILAFLQAPEASIIELQTFEQDPEFPTPHWLQHAQPNETTLITQVLQLFPETGRPAWLQDYQALLQIPEYSPRRLLFAEALRGRPLPALERLRQSDEVKLATSCRNGLKLPSRVTPIRRSIAEKLQQRVDPPPPTDIPPLPIHTLDSDARQILVDSVIAAHLTQERHLASLRLSPLPEITRDSVRFKNSSITDSCGFGTWEFDLPDDFSWATWLRHLVRRGSLNTPLGFAQLLHLRPGPVIYMCQETYLLPFPDEHPGEIGAVLAEIWRQWQPPRRKPRRRPLTKIGSDEVLALLLGYQVNLPPFENDDSEADPGVIEHIARSHAVVIDLFPEQAEALRAAYSAAAHRQQQLDRESHEACQQGQTDADDLQQNDIPLSPRRLDPYLSQCLAALSADLPLWQEALPRFAAVLREVMQEELEKTSESP